MADHDVPAGATVLARLTLVRMPNGTTRIALIETTAELKRDYRSTPFPTLIGYVRHLIADATRGMAARTAKPKSAAIAEPFHNVPLVQAAGELVTPPCKFPPNSEGWRYGQRREQDEWVCACGCGRRWPANEERPA